MPLAYFFAHEYKKTEGEKFERRFFWELMVSYKKARRGKRKTNDEHKFELNEAANLVQLEHDILLEKYQPGRGIAFVIFWPVIREIFAAPFRDRVVHHWLYSQTEPWWEKHFIYDSYSCRKGKGPQFGVARMKRMMNQAKSKWPAQRVFCVKMDLQGYFMSLSREMLYERVCWGLCRQFPSGGRRYDILRYLWKQVIFDDPIIGVKLRGKRTDWERLPRSKTLFGQPNGVGIVIGNLSSQLLSNIFMDQFDQHMKHDLKYRFYGRYVDDFFVIIPESNLKQFWCNLEEMKHFLTGMGLTLHPDKTRMYEVGRQAVPFLGMRVYPDRVFPDRRLISNFRRAIDRRCYGFCDDNTIVSYLGFMKHSNSDKIVELMFDRVGWRYEPTIKNRRKKSRR